MLDFIRTDASNSDFIKLVDQLDAELAIRDGDDHDFYHQYNSIANIKYAIVGYVNGLPMGCGAIKAFDEVTMEVKRMYTSPNGRGKGMASSILAELEKWTKEMNYSRCILETGKAQPEAISLYRKQGYIQVPNYGQYQGIDNSLCFEKKL